MAKRENPRRREREFNKLQEKQNRRERASFAPAKETNIEAVREDLVIGRNAVIEALKSDRTIECIYAIKGDLEGSIKVALGLAKEKGIVIKEADRRKLDTMSEGLNHQGIIAKVTPFKYSEVSYILDYAEKKGEKPFIVILDEIEDPHNLGSIIRTAELCGVHGIIIPKRRNVGVTSTVYKCAAGAIEHMRIAKVTNINATIDLLKERGIWVYGADIHGKDYSYNTDFSGPCALIIGSEGKGISNLTLKKCDLLVKIPMIGKINSLNASVAGGIMMYEVLKGRLTK
ncbi:23S rRNA (guanosine(2251)-2'-O)-methyltransferase RlmB [Clostridium celatum]|uniref:RNA methyltransferase, TrmH family, group 3 n=1 Tax=Clostridium celatum DSM 1785 TaxID=545697 RepID=L1QCA6_9CLOT|nr:23S rRNA (guanosine(2251)-2'-O)-methyltransferase RlmB [Clostridium celatum]EKY25613.1 RNA methyltransferase, TrmH family, group 3 [Clostridium celatum DSM 1785]MCE9655473.1 23S rRNA (guanosine(2251)-2'-O)-methyltransferase RlmB [Clostridium celatum]MDU2266512.1 23S rRNA (guanosine(2251)-2'-O)-methyltransferase RlmB [Clostridium celatum]MDU3723027.1 23S rRNA (guanosine(2251)-2'-O)-methyltransferase RlmB [Clostridium celatum]MDU6296852.1 23S rRNA (guanosine(2251)-2'-O)-methyltransferase RlmB